MQSDCYDCDGLKHNFGRRTERSVLTSGGGDNPALRIDGKDVGCGRSGDERAQKAIGREINPTVYPPAEFRSKNERITNLWRQEFRTDSYYGFDFPCGEG